MNYLITGGAGLIGSALSQALLRDGEKVIILSRNPKARAPAGAEIAAWDGKTTQGWAQLLENIDVVVNLAGENIGARRWTAQRLDRIRESRLNAGRAVVEAFQAAAKRPKVLIQASAVGYYGVENRQPLNESDPPGIDTLSGICVDWEASTAAVEAMGVRRAVIRSGFVLSTQAPAFQRMLLPFRLFAGGPLGSGQQWFAWIHLADEIEAIRFLVENDNAQGVYNLTAPEPATNADFGRELGRAMRRPYWLPAPAFALRLLLGRMSTLVLDGQRPMPKRLLEAGYCFRFDTVRAALQDLLG